MTLLEIKEKLEKHRNILYTASDGIMYLIPSGNTPDWVLCELSNKLREV